MDIEKPSRWDLSEGIQGGHPHTAVACKIILPQRQQKAIGEKERKNKMQIPAISRMRGVSCCSFRACRGFVSSTFCLFAFVSHERGGFASSIFAIELVVIFSLFMPKFGQVSPADFWVFYVLGIQFLVVGKTPRGHYY